MSRAANADFDISDEETAVMERFVRRARRARRAAGDPRRRDGEDPGAGPGRDRGLRRDPRVPRDLDAGAAASSSSAAASRSRRSTARSPPQEAGDDQRDRPRARHRAPPTSTRSARSSTSSCRRSRRSAERAVRAPARAERHRLSRRAEPGHRAGAVTGRARCGSDGANPRDPAVRCRGQAAERDAERRGRPWSQRS